MIRTGAEFQSENKKLNMLYRKAHGILLDSFGFFGDRKLITGGIDSRRLSLVSDILGAETLASYDLMTALDSVMAFFVSRRSDGRLASALTAKGRAVIPEYDEIEGLSFIDEALSLFYLSKKKELGYLRSLYTVLSDYDAYLWSRHDMDETGLLALLSESDAVKEGALGRFAPLRMVQAGGVHTVSPLPIESYALLSEDLAIVRVLAECAALLGNGKEKQWQDKGELLSQKLKENFWFDSMGAFFDRDYRGGVIDHVTVSNLLPLYYQAVEPQVAEALLETQILNPERFWTAMPLPSVLPASHDCVTSDEPNENGASLTLSIRRAIRAFENYGAYTTVTELGRRFLEAVTEEEVFPVQFDPISGKPTGLAAGTENMLAASTALEFIKRFWGVHVERNALCFGTLGTAGDEISEYNFFWGSDIYSVRTERHTTSVFLTGKHLFTVTGGTRVFTDSFGMSPRVVNVTTRPIDCIFVYRNRTYSFSLEPNEVWREAPTKKK